MLNHVDSVITIFHEQGASGTMKRPWTLGPSPVRNRRLESATEVCWPRAPIRHHIGEPVKEFTEMGVPIHRNAECEFLI